MRLLVGSHALTRKLADHVVTEYASPSQALLYVVAGVSAHLSPRDASRFD